VNGHAQGQLTPQYVGTSDTQIESHCVVQQYGSCEQTAAAQEEQLAVSALPALQTGCAHDDPPSVPASEPPPVHDCPQTDWTSPTQTLSHAVAQQ